MKTIRVEKDELLSILKANRDKHEAIFVEACIGYRTACIVALEKRLAQIQSGGNIQMYFQITEPVNQTKDYDKVIAMLEMSLDTEIELTQQEFANYVLDDWSWKDQFWATNSVYTMTNGE